MTVVMSIPAGASAAALRRLTSRRCATRAPASRRGRWCVRSHRLYRIGVSAADAPICRSSACSLRRCERADSRSDPSAPRLTARLRSRASRGFRPAPRSRAKYTRTTRRRYAPRSVRPSDQPAAGQRFGGWAVTAPLRAMTDNAVRGEQLRAVHDRSRRELGGRGEEAGRVRLDEQQIEVRESPGQV